MTSFFICHTMNEIHRQWLLPLSMGFLSYGTGSDAGVFRGRAFGILILTEIGWHKSGAETRETWIF